MIAAQHAGGEGWKDIPTDFKTKMAVGDAVKVINAGTVDFYSATDQILFHWNPRQSDKIVVRNSKIGSWGNEERGGGWPFTQPADTILVRTATGWAVSIGSVHKPAFDFQQRNNQAVARITGATQFKAADRTRTSPRQSLLVRVRVRVCVSQCVCHSVCARVRAHARACV